MEPSGLLLQVRGLWPLEWTIPAQGSESWNTRTVSFQVLDLSRLGAGGVVGETWAPAPTSGFSAGAAASSPPRAIVLVTLCASAPSSQAGTLPAPASNDSKGNVHKTFRQVLDTQCQFSDCISLISISQSSELSLLSSRHFMNAFLKEGT